MKRNLLLMRSFELLNPITSKSDFLLTSSLKENSLYLNNDLVLVTPIFVTVNKRILKGTVTIWISVPRAIAGEQ